jgi:hypothetical protein
MANNYYTRVFNAAPDTRARSGDVKAEYDNLVAAFDKLPQPHPTLKGFNEPIVVGTPTQDSHAAPKSFVSSFTGNGILVGTSSSSVSYGTGSKTFSLAESVARSWVVGTELKAVSQADNSKYMIGKVTSYSHPSVTINVLYTNQSSGSDSSWVIAPAMVSVATRFPSGSASQPGLYAEDYTATGLYAALNQLGISINGSSVALITTSAFTFSVAPTYNADPASANVLSRKSYVDAADAATLSSANSYSDTQLASGTVTVTNKTYTNPGHTTQTLTDGATVSWNMNLGHIATLTLGGNRTISNPTNLKAGSALLILNQDATGGRTVTWGSAYKWPSGTPPALSSAANATDIITFVSDGTNLYGNILRGFA